ncbi:MAG TPA: hypothetical protein VEK39_12575 [Solirubrobacterales bacterium]|nr:hypothetical protein [Solirubrobacterales bacterium]
MIVPTACAAMFFSGCVRENPAGESIGAIDVELGASGIAVGAGWVWVAEAQGDETVSRIDPAKAEFVGTPTKLKGYVEELAGDDEGVWVLGRDTVTRVDSDGRVLGEPIDIGGGSIRIAAGDEAAWVANPKRAEVIRIDAQSRQIRRIPLRARPRSVAVGYGSVWIGGSDGRITRLDSKSGRVLGTTRLEGSVHELAVGAGFAWAVTSLAPVRLDPDTGEIVSVVEQNGDETTSEENIVPGDVIDAGLGSLWGGGFRELTRIDADEGSVIGSIRIGTQEDASIAGIAITPETVWVLNPIDAEVERIEP